MAAVERMMLLNADGGHSTDTRGVAGDGGAARERVLNIASTASYQPTPYALAVYGASQVVRAELVAVTVARS